MQCKDIMWKLNERKLPLGVQTAGGSDWFCLNYELVDYIMKDESIEKLLQFFNYTLLPSETFFHTVILNTKFCQAILDLK